MRWLAPISGRPTEALARASAGIPAASGAIVMGTGIVSIALALDGRGMLSRILLAVAAGAWISLGLLLVVRALHDRCGVRREACSPAALTGVAATAVLGMRVTMLGWPWAGELLLAIAFVMWCTLLVPVLAHWVTPTVGISLMVAVATESLAVLSARIADDTHEPWLLEAALAPFALGLACGLARLAGPLAFGLARLTRGFA
jgi:hypothetical protein